MKKEIVVCPNCGSTKFEKGKCVKCNSDWFSGMYLYPFERKKILWIIIAFIIIGLFTIACIYLKTQEMIKENNINELLNSIENYRQ